MNVSSNFQDTSYRLVGLFRELDYGYDFFPAKIIDYFRPKYDRVDQEKSWKATSLGLYVFIHGLRGHPACWNHHVRMVQEHDRIDLFVPYVPLKGNGPIKEFSKPIYTVVESYAKQHPNRPICLIGVSNGGRICTWIETRLRKTVPTTPVKVSTIAAVHLGTSRMDLLKRVADFIGFRFGYHKELMEDLCLESPQTKKLISKVCRSLPDGVIRDFEFYSSHEDFCVPESFSSHPLLPHHTINHVIRGYNHNGIVKGVSAQQMSSCCSWMNSFLPEGQMPAFVDIHDPCFSRKQGFWSTPAQESETSFFKRLTLKSSQRENWYHVTPYIAEFWCTISNIGFIALGVYYNCPELVFAGIASAVSHAIPKNWLNVVDKIGVALVIAKLAREYKVVLDHPRLLIPLATLGLINFVDFNLAKYKAQTWQHVFWHLTAAAVAGVILSKS